MSEPAPDLKSLYQGKPCKRCFRTKPRREGTVQRYEPSHRAVSNMVTTFSGGTPAWMLWTEPNT